MNKFLSKSLVAAVALAASSIGQAATVSFSVIENSGVANDGLVNVGATFSVVMSGQGFPDTGGFTLLLNFAPVATVNTPTTTAGIVVPGGSPFAAGAIAPSPFLSGNQFTILAPTSGALPAGNFSAAQFNFTATALGLLNLSIGDDGVDNVWTDGNTFEPIPVTYNYSGAFVQVIPVPAAAWLFVSAIGGLAALKRRQAK